MTNAQRIAACLATRLGSPYVVRAAESRCQIGSGALPEATLPSAAVAITAPSDGDLRNLATRLRHLTTPVIGRIHDGVLTLDVRTIDDVDALSTNLDAL
jgi:L-seryl-tRNA(Ser) seleniumtransferase